MRSGPGESWIDRRDDGWYACEVGGNWTFTWGPYRWKLIAWWVWLWECD